MVRSGSTAAAVWCGSGFSGPKATSRAGAEAFPNAPLVFYHICLTSLPGAYEVTTWILTCYQLSLGRKPVATGLTSADTTCHGPWGESTSTSRAASARTAGRAGRKTPATPGRHGRLLHAARSTKRLHHPQPPQEWFALWSMSISRTSKRPGNGGGDGTTMDRAAKEYEKEH